MLRKTRFRKGCVVPMTFVVMIIASLLTLQAMHTIRLEQQNIFERFDTQQAIEYVELGKHYVRSQLKLDPQFEGKEIEVSGACLELSDDSCFKKDSRIAIRRKEPVASNESAQVGWDIQVWIQSGSNWVLASTWEGSL